ncbi:MAG: glycosyltransferase family 2 protein [Arenimonas sp.]
MPRALILCPTHDHVDALYASIASVLAQTERDFELVVIGDGAPERTQRIVAALAATDARMSAVWHPKSERFGEVYRDPVIRASTAEFVCHLSDDDLWLPTHLATMLALLEHADWANQAPLRLTLDGRAEWWPVNHGTPALRASVQRRVPLSAGLNYVAYRRDAYLRLPEGWTCAPWEAGTSDVYMWAKFFALPGLRVASSAVSTALKFPSHVGERDTHTPEQRLAEIAPWLARSAEPRLGDRLRRRADIEARMVMLFAVHEIAGADPLDAALARCGLCALPDDAPPGPALDGAPMPLPVTSAQRAQAERAWRFVQAYRAGEDPVAVIDRLYAGASVAATAALAALQAVTIAAASGPVLPGIGPVRAPIGNETFMKS